MLLLTPYPVLPLTNFGQMCFSVFSCVCFVFQGPDDRGFGPNGNACREKGV